MERILRLNEVSKLVGLRLSVICDRIKRDQLLKQLLLGERTVSWRESEIADWIALPPLAPQRTPVHSELIDQHRHGALPPASSAVELQIK